MAVYHVPVMKKKEYKLQKMKALLEKHFAVLMMVAIGMELQVRNLKRTYIMVTVLEYYVCCDLYF